MGFAELKLRGALLLAVLGIGFSACATQQAMDTERMLAASGFHMKLADNPEKLSHVTELTQRKVVPHEKDGKTYFVYADAKYCKCVYIGDQEAYQEFSQMLEQKEMEDEDRMISEENRDASMNWALWGPWPLW